MAWTEKQDLKPAKGAMVIESASVGGDGELKVTGYKCDAASRALLGDAAARGIAMKTESTSSEVILTKFNADVKYTEVEPATPGAALQPASALALKNWIDKQLPKNGLSPALPPRPSGGMRAGGTRVQVPVQPGGK